jgi:hypothetical protein
LFLLVALLRTLMLLLLLVLLLVLLLLLLLLPFAASAGAHGLCLGPQRNVQEGAGGHHVPLQPWNFLMQLTTSHLPGPWPC